MISDFKGPLLPLILLTLASLVSCSRTRFKPGRTQSAPPRSVSVSPSPVTSAPSPNSNRVITIHALDNEYRGSTSILPDNGLDHQKGSHD